MVAVTNGNHDELLQRIQQLEGQVILMQEKENITALLNLYAEELDQCGPDPTNWSKGWEHCFHDDCFITYPFGSYQGKRGLGQWASTNMKKFVGYHHLSSNFQITLGTPDAKGQYTTASARTNLQAYHVLEHDPSAHFAEGGFYQWTFEKDDIREWKIKGLKLHVTWISGSDILNSFVPSETVDGIVRTSVDMALRVVAFEPCPELSKTAKVKRTRVAKACDNCRFLRIKCDGKHPCHPCASKDEICEFSRTSTRPTLTLASSKDYINELRRNIRELEAKVSSEEAIVNLRPPNRSFAESYVEESSATGVHAFNTKTQLSEFYGPSSPISFLRQLSSVVQITLAHATPGTAKGWPPGNSSSMDDSMVINDPIISSMEGSVQDSLETKSGDALFSISHTHAQDIMETYWHAIAPGMGIFDQDEFKSVFDEMFKDSGHFLKLLHPDSRLSSRSWFSCHETKRDLSIVEICLALALQYRQNTESETHFVRSRRYLAEMLDNPGFGTVRLLLCMAIWQYNALRLNDAYRFLGCSIRSALSIGLHRETTGKSTIIPPAFRELRRRTWWLLYCMDVCLCYETGRPASILIRETSTSLPLESRTWREEQGILVKLSHVAILAYRQIYGTQELDNHTVFEFGKLEKLRQASGLLRRWEDDFKPFEARLADNAATKLLLKFNVTKVILYRPFLLTNNSSPMFDSYASECTNACSQVVHLVKIHQGLEQFQGADVFLALWNVTLALMARTFIAPQAICQGQPVIDILNSVHDIFNASDKPMSTAWVLARDIVAEYLLNFRTNIDFPCEGLQLQDLESFFLHEPSNDNDMDFLAGFLEFG